MSSGECGINSVDCNRIRRRRLPISPWATLAAPRAGESGLSQLPFKGPESGVRRQQNLENPANFCDIIATTDRFLSIWAKIA
jgi:hypothetical protein